MKPNKPDSTYFMPKCYACGKRFKIVKKDCTIISFLSKDDEGGYHRDTHYEIGTKSCPSCTEECKRIGPRAFLKKMLKD